MKFCYTLFLLLLAAGLLTAEPAVPVRTSEGFKVPQPGSTLEFPQANGAHPQFKIEWWYLTGHLFSDSGRRFGYQATFFRSGLQPANGTAIHAFGNGQAYLGHMALTDESGRRFYYEERLSRDSWDAYARTGQLDVRNGDWLLKTDPDNPSKMLLNSSIRSDASFAWVLEPEKPIVRFGEDGTSRKGPSPIARSYYLSYTRLHTSGTIRIGDETFRVTGTSWMDHEIASSQLDPGYTGWDWIAIQLKDGWEVKAYLLRESDGSPSPFSALIWISPQGELHYRKHDEFTWNKSSEWLSTKTGYRYPVRPRITTRHPVTMETVHFQFNPILDNQELALPGTTYWEGAGDVTDGDGNNIGNAYLELVGYGGKLRGLQ